MTTPCKRAAELISLSLERRLSWRERLALGLHLCFCDVCNRFRRQMRLIQQAGAAAGLPEHVADGEASGLSEVARERIRRALRERGSGGTP